MSGLPFPAEKPPAPPVEKMCRAVRVSVVVPTCRRPVLLTRCLIALLTQDLDPEDYEIIVADDAAAPQTQELVRDLGRHRKVSRDAPSLIYVPVTGRHGPAAARNRGWQASRGEIIAFIDDDCIPDARWLRSGIAAFGDGVSAVCGRVFMPLPDRPTDYELNASELSTKSEFVTANCFCRREVLKAVEGFDERFTAAWREDSDLHFKLIERGARIVRRPEALVLHPIRPARWGVSLSQQRKVQFDILLYKKHRRLYRERIRPKPLWEYYRILCALAAGIVSAAAGWTAAAALAFGAWAGLSSWFCARRLRGTSHSLRHVSEMAVTSALIPPIAVYWRIRGMVKFRTVLL